MKLIAKDLECQRGGRHVFGGMSFEVPAGSGLLLKGPNGSGKTSLLRMIAGLGDIAAGTLELDGLDDELTIGQRAHYVAHQNALKTAMSVEENLTFWARFMGVACSSVDVREHLARFDLERLAGYSAALLSAGQRRRLALSRLELVPRPVWLLDEPSVGLDAASVELLAAAMRRHTEGGGILLASTHTDLALGFNDTLDLSTFAGRAA
ncbi:MAG: heme ABC exporter ATP-binding protein CcmA [Pseudomonadota bacterium]